MTLVPSRFFYLRGDKLLSNRDYSTKTENYLTRGLTNRDQDTYARLLDFTTQKYGFKSSETHKVAKIILEKFYQKPIDRNLRALVQIFSINKNEANLQLLLSAVRKKTNLKKSLYLEDVTRTDIFNKSSNHPRNSYLNDWAIKTHENETSRISDIFKNELDSCCLVGNSPSLIGKNLGQQIDKTKYVFRFNEFQIEGFEDDYGSKSSFWVVNKGLLKNKQLKTSREKIVSWIISSNNYIFKELNYSQHLDTRYISSQQFSVIPAEIFQNLIQKLNCLPSSGLSLAYWMYKESGKKISRNSVFGFSHLTGAGFNDHYFKGLDDKKHVHNWAEESNIFRGISQ